MQMIELGQLVALDRQAVLETQAAVRHCDDLTKPTPCAGWALADLLAHMTVQQHGFARAARGEVTEVADWHPQPRGDAIGEYVAACAAVLESFAAVADPGAAVVLPEIRDHPVPAQTAIGFHLVDNVVHAWDVAVSVGSRVSFADEVLAAALGVARQVPDGAERDRPGAAFAHAYPIPPDASALDEILLLLGRDPAWTAA